MILVRWGVYGLATWMVLVGLWAHDWRLILAGVATWLVFPLVASDVATVACLGCTKGRIVPGCPVHDPERRKAAA